MAIGGLADTITREIASKGQWLRSVDVVVAMAQGEAGGAENAAFRREGALSETFRLRAMAQRVGQGAGNGPSAVLTELKGVDGAYPLYGALVLKGGRAGPMRADEPIGRASCRARVCQSV